MFVGSLLRNPLVRGQALVLVAAAAALVIVLIVVALAVANGTLTTTVGVDDGRLMGPFRWFPIDPADG